jgi:hypothetical protein
MLKSTGRGDSCEATAEVDLAPEVHEYSMEEGNLLITEILKDTLLCISTEKIEVAFFLNSSSPRS